VLIVDVQRLNYAVHGGWLMQHILWLLDRAEDGVEALSRDKCGTNDGTKEADGELLKTSVEGLAA
jgi:hypothetical protein